MYDRFVCGGRIFNTKSNMKFVDGVALCQSRLRLFSKDAFSRNLCLFYYMFKILHYKHGCHATCPGRFAT